MGHRSGFVLLEGLIAVLVFALLATAVMVEVIYGQRASVRASDLNRAYSLALEGMEAVRDIRMDDFSALQDGTYGLAATAEGQWRLVANQPEIIDSYFQRTINICPGGPPYEYQCMGTDPNIKRVEVAVGWQGQSAARLTTEMMNWIPTIEDWSDPKFDGSFDLTAANSGSNNHKVRTLKVSGLRLLVGNDNSAGKEFLIFNLRSAPTINIEGSLDLDGNPQDIAVYQTIAYIVSSSQTEELQVIDIANPAVPALANITNLSGNDDGLSIDINVNDRRLVLGRAGGNLYIFDISLPNQPALLGSLTLNGSPDINDLKIRGTTVFIAAGDGSVRTVDIGNPSSPAPLANLSLPECDRALSLAVTATRFYAGCNGDSDDPELFIGDATNPSSLFLYESANIGGSSADVKYIAFNLAKSAFSPPEFSNLLFLLTGDTAKDFQVWDVTTDVMPTRLSYLNLLGSPTQSDYSPLAQKVFVGFISNPEIQIVAPELIYQFF